MARAATKAKETTTTRKGPSATMPEIVKGSLRAVLALEGVSKTNQLLNVSPDLLRVIPGFNPRIHELDRYKSDAAELMDSIREEGFYADKPIAGYVGKDGEADVIFITDGHRRFEAVQALMAEGIAFPTLPVVLKPAETDMAKLTISTVRSNSGRRLTFFENAIIVRRLLKHGMSKGEIAKALGFTERAVDDFFTMIEAPKKVRDLVKMERISGTEAVRILNKIKDPEKASAKIIEMVEIAEKKGKAKATRAESGDAPIKGGRKSKANGENDNDENDSGGSELPENGEVTSARKPSRKKGFYTTAVSFAAIAGDEVAISDIRNFKNLFADQNWFKLDDDRPNLVIITEDIEFVAYITRPRMAPEQKEVGDDDEEESEGEEEGVEEEATEDATADL